jgi:hypothetical protein
MHSDLFLDPNLTRDQLITKRDELQNENDLTQERLTALKDQIETQRGRRFAGERINAQWWADANNEARAMGLRVQKLQSAVGEIGRRIRRIDGDAIRRADFAILIEITKQHVSPDLFETIWTDFAARKNARA